MILRLLILSGVLFVGSACTPPRHNWTGKSEGASQLKTALSQPDSIDYEKVKQFVFSPNCVGCHNSTEKKDGVDLSSYASVVFGHGDRKIIEPFNPAASALYTVLSAEGKRHMPPLDHPQLSSDQIELIYAWLEKGAKETASSTVARPPTLKEQLQPYFDHPENIDYKVVKANVTDVCLKCHSLTGATPDREAIANSANMTTFDSLFGPFTPIIERGRPEESKIFQAVAMTQTMPPPKEGYDPLDGLRIKVLRLWILNCAIEDKAALTGEELHINPDNPEKVRLCP